jgi:aerobic C4-dicarboxylate transport protein
MEAQPHGRNLDKRWFVGASRASPVTIAGDTMSSPDPATSKKASHLYLWVLVGVLIGGVLGVCFPDRPATPDGGKAVVGFASQLKPLADGFIALIKMMISPIIFCTVVLGIAGMADMRALGRVGGKAFIYFEVVSTLALLIGLLVANTAHPGAGFNVDPKTLDASKITGFVARAADQTFVDYILHIIPKTFLDAFTGSGDLLQVLLIAILFGTALSAMGERGRAVHAFLDGANLALFGVVNMIMRLAPIGACAAMAFTIGKYGLDSLIPLAKLMGAFYLTCFLFVGVVLGTIAYATGFSLWRFLLYIRAEILTVLGTSSSESALVPLMEKLQKLGCSKSVVGVVVPAGYSFNLDGTNIYLTLAALFVAQALNIDLTMTQQLTILGVAMLTSKGASGVTGAGFVTLAATLAVVPDIPVAGMALILGIDRFMSEARAITNFIGNGVATVVVSRWEKELDRETLQRELAAGSH